MEEYLIDIIEKMRLNFYRKVFTSVKEREGSLSAMEVFSVEIINAMDSPTIGQFARFIGISQPNASYKVQSLIKKGYIKRMPSDFDKREYHLELTEKYYSYSKLFDEDVKLLAKRLSESLPEKDYADVTGVLKKISMQFTESLNEELKETE